MTVNTVMKMRNQVMENRMIITMVLKMMMKMVVAKEMRDTGMLQMLMMMRRQGRA